jgi:DNA-binding transcriptional regulator YiaG
VVIPRIEDLHRVIAQTLLDKREQLVGAEIAFLRKWLGWSQTELARQMHVDKSTANRWENDKQPIGEGADLLLRAYVALGKRIESYSVDEMDRRAVADPVPVELRLEADERGWRRAA